MKRVLKLVIAGLLYVSLAACMFRPYSGQKIASRSTPIDVAGCSATANTTIRVEAADNRFGSFPNVGTIATLQSAANVSTTDTTGSEWYCWQTKLVIPPQFWTTITFETVSLSAAWVRAFDSGFGNYAFTYENDPAKCTLPAGIPQLTNDLPCALSADQAQGGRGFVAVVAPPP